MTSKVTDKQYAWLS